MCGIIAGKLEQGNNIIPILFEGLKKLEYRGNDSWGIRTPNFSQREVGSVHKAKLGEYNIPQSTDNIGLAHTRWATSSEVSVANCHPITSANGRFSIVHNGIVENYNELLNYGWKHGNPLRSTLDTELIVEAIQWLVDNNYEQEDVKTQIDAISKQIKGNNSFVVLDNQEGQLYAYSFNMPLYVSYDKGYIISSDPVVFKELYAKLPSGWVMDLDDIGSCCMAWKDPVALQSQSAEGHQMLAEIYQQASLHVKLPDWYRDLQKEVVIYGCGSSLNAGLMVKKFLEPNDVRCTVVHSMEVKELNLNNYKDATFFAISQSGETKDTLEATKFLKLCGVHPKSITNNDYNSLAIVCGNNFNLGCGPENGVAATKTFWQTINLFFDLVYDREYEVFDHELKELDKQTQSLAKEICGYNHILILSSPYDYPIALEGALKIKEVANIHAEALFSAEVKHGPLSLIDDKVLSIFLVDEDNQEILNNIEQVRARGGKLLLVGKPNVINGIVSDTKIFLPESILHDFVGFLLALQFLSYHLAVAKQLNPDRPRSLAKSVTV